LAIQSLWKRPALANQSLTETSAPAMPDRSSTQAEAISRAAD
jgi:hypothetical protein